MSIPPLVCSTPPPLEQCEDDKDPEDFDLQYNLSQDDEDNEFAYGNFTTFNSFHTVTNKSSSPTFKTDYTAPINLPKNIQNDEEPKVMKDEILNNLNEISFEEDINIEDLNLNVGNSCTKESPKNNGELANKDKVEVTTDIPCDSSDISQTDCKISSIKENITSFMTPEISETLQENSETLCNEENNECDNVSDLKKYSDKVIIDESMLNAVDDNFDDFDEFNFTNSIDTTKVVIDSNNPWENSNVEDVAFGDFTANFGEDENKFSEQCLTEEQSVDSTYPDPQTDTKTYDDFDQDFGDFDEFKCSSTEDQDNVSVQETMSSNSVPVLNFQSDNEHQLIESLNKVLQSIFKEEISESTDKISNNLDASLGETWGYLKDTDARLPYMVNWNNSLAQKTLLKALCIDSRNILFGPKWSSNMPKYAVNLSAAPLMPQKQGIQANNVQSEPTSNTDKSANKSSWVDPFTSDGQESCNADSENSTIEAGPTDLDVFEATIATKSEKIYSSTLNIQPMRQINLPDTHIFTPTDSETPRSKTIHYNTNHNILMPQQVTVVKTSLDSFSTPQTIKNSPPENDEYWEFQNFTASDTKSHINRDVEDKNIERVADSDAHSKPEYIYETQVLQPIKLELTIPTLNWPNPGEVKETFEDFTDFISKTVPDIVNPMPSKNLQDNVNKETLSIVEDNVLQNRPQKSTGEEVDDDFDMFQSALPSDSKISQLDTEREGNSAESIPKFDNFFMKQDHVSNHISDTVPIDNMKQDVENLPKTSEIKNVTPVFGKSITNSNLLQPTSIATNIVQQNQQKSGQILQPLSLESYSQINWPNPGIDLQDLSRFNPVESLHSLKSDVSNHSKNSSPMHSLKGNNQPPDEDIWGEFVSSAPKAPPVQAKKVTTFVDDDEWTDFVSSPSVNPPNGLNTISFNVHTNSNIQKSSNPSKYPLKSNEIQLDIPTLNYITPKNSSQKSYNDRHFQNL